jgi:hypothetical protein
MSHRTLSAAAGLIAAAVALAPVTPALAERAGLKMINVHGDPKILLVLTPNHLPSGRVEDDVRLVNRSTESYCFRFEVYDEAWVYVPRHISVVTAPPNSAYQVVKLGIYAPGSKYRFKFNGVYLKDSGSTDCRRAQFPASTAE